MSVISNNRPAVNLHVANEAAHAAHVKSQKKARASATNQATHLIGDASNLPSYVRDDIAGVQGLLTHLNEVANSYASQSSAGGAASAGSHLSTHELEAEFFDAATAFQQQLNDQIAQGGTKVDVEQLQELQKGVTLLVQDAKNAFTELNKEATDQEKSGLAQGLTNICGAAITGIGAGWIGFSGQNSFLKVNTLSQSANMGAGGLGSAISGGYQAAATEHGATAGKDSQYAQTAQQVLSSLLGVATSLLQTLQGLVNASGQAADAEMGAAAQAL